MKTKNINRSKWVFQATELYAEEESTISWAGLIPPSFGSKHQRAYLMKSMKGFFKAASSSLHTDIQYDQSTLQVRYRYIVTIVRWMIERNIWRLSALTEDEFINFMQDRKGKFDNSAPSESSIERWLAIAERMWIHRQQYVGSIQFNPASLRAEVYARCRPIRPRPFKAIPEEAALPLIQDALLWNENYAPYVMEIVNNSWGSTKKQVGWTRTKKQQAAKRFYEELDADEKFCEIRKMLTSDSPRAYDVLKKAVAHTQGATIIILLFVLGLRNRELVRLDCDCIKSEEELSETNYYIEGIAAKKGGKRRRWAVFGPIVKVIDDFVRYFSPMRQVTGCNALLINDRTLFSALRSTPKRIVPLTVAKRMREFAKAPYRASRPKIQRLHPHAARKTFARFAVKRNKQALEPMAWQYGHAYAEFTDGVYVGSDIELVEMMREEDQKELARSLEALLLADRIAGKAAHALEKSREEVAKNLQFKGKTGLRTLVARLIDQKICIAPCDWGFCVYSMSISACAGGETGPNLANRSPEICAGCANFVVTEKNLGWWDMRAKRDELYLKSPELPMQSIALVKRRLQISHSVIGAIQFAKKSEKEKT